MRCRVVLWVLLAGLLALAATVRYQPGWLQTDLLALVGEGQLPAATSGARDQLEAKLQGSLVWMLVGPATETGKLVRATEVLARRLSEADVITELQYRWADEGRYQKEWELLFPLRQQLLAPDERQLLAVAPDKLVGRQMAAIYRPDGAALDLEQDPFSTFRHYFTGSAKTATQVFGEIPVQRQGNRAFTLLKAVAAPAQLSGNIHTPLLSLRARLKAWAGEQGMSLYAAGAPLHTEFAAAGAQREIRLIGGLSIATICLLSVLVFRSFRPLLLSVFAIACGIATGTVAVITLLGQIHILAFVFGTTVTGLAIDYAFHFTCNRMRPGPARDSDVMPGLLLGLVSSCLAFFALALAPFPLLQQMGLFVGSGLIGAWLTVVLLFPALLRVRQQPLGIRRNSPGLKLPGYAMAVGLSLVAGLVSIPQIEFADDLALFYKPPRYLAADEEELNRLLPSRADSRYFIVQGNDWRQVLEREWQLTRKLETLQEKGELEAYQALSERFPPEKIQRADWTLMRDFYGSAPVEGFFTQLGYSDSEARTVITKLQQPFREISLPAWLAVAGPQYSELWLGCDDHGCASVVRVFSGQRSVPLPEDIVGVYLVDPPGAMAEVMAEQRDLLLALLPVLLAMVFAVVAARVGIRQAALVVALPLSAVLVTLAVTVLGGSAVNLFHVAALLLVFGIGVDYAVFSHMSKGSERNYTLLAIGMAGVTTLLGFGLLALSATPAIADFGLTLAIGTTLTLLLAILFFANAVEGSNR